MIIFFINESFSFQYKERNYLRVTKLNWNLKEWKGEYETDQCGLYRRLQLPTPLPPLSAVGTTPYLKSQSQSQSLFLSFFTWIESLSYLSIHPASLSLSDLHPSFKSLARCPPLSLSLRRFSLTNPTSALSLSP